MPEHLSASNVQRLTGCKKFVGGETIDLQSHWMMIRIVEKPRRRYLTQGGSGLWRDELGLWRTPDKTH
jgi:hypothetical protein